MPTTIPSEEVPVQGYDPARGEAAFEAIRPEAEALAPADVLRISLSLLQAGLRILTLAKRVRADEALCKRFATVPDTLFDPGHLERLEDLGWAAIHMYMLLLKARAVDSEALVPIEVVNEAVEIKDRMMKTVEYHLSDLPGVGEEVASIRAGSGRTDLALDLHRLAPIYEDWKTQIEHDKKHYRAQDATDARRVGDQMFEAIASAKMTGLPEDTPARVFTLLRRSYDEVRDTALWLLRDNPRAQAGFPALHAQPATGDAKSAPITIPTSAELAEA